MDLTISDIYGSVTENETLVVDHGFSNQAVARASVNSNLTLFMCTFEVGGGLQTFFDMRASGGSGFVSMQNASYA